MCKYVQMDIMLMIQLAKIYAVQLALDCIGSVIILLKVVFLFVLQVIKLLVTRLVINAFTYVLMEHSHNWMLIEDVYQDARQILGVTKYQKFVLLNH